MLKEIKKLYNRNKRFLEAYGGEATRNTYLGQLNFESGKIFFVLYITLVVWLPYISNDMKLHQYPTLAVGLRVTLSVLSAVIIVLKCTKLFKNRPGILLIALMTYFYLGTALITATAGNAAPAYIGGFSFILMVPVFAPFSFKFKAVASLTSFAMFFVVGIVSGLDFTDNSVMYSVNDLFSSLLISLLLSRSQDGVRYEAWKQQQKLNDMVSRQEKNLATIFKLASEAETASKSKSDFLANMSHEIRTPMNAIIGISELMMQKEIPPDIYEDALAIKHAGNNLLSIINDILDISKIESGKLELIPTEYYFASVFNDVCSIVRTRISEKDIVFLTYMDSTLPNKLYGDEIRVRQILLNLLSNAAKYTEKGFISISVNGEVENNVVYLEISISDSGIGIKEEDSKKLFNKFTQVDTQRNREIEGTGLGLAISRQLCAMMDGDIGVASEYGRGSTFTISIAQKIVDSTRIAVVNNPEEARTLLYEVRPLYEESASQTLCNLNVPHKVVSQQSAFGDEIINGKYRYIFIPMFLYDGIKHIIDDFKPEGVVVLLAEFGEVVRAGNVKMLSMPISCFTVASVLNNEEIRIYKENKETLNSFVAPEAKILIVDDIGINLKVAEGLMSHFKMKIDVCLSGEKAIELAKQNIYDIIFMDHMMPGMDGIEAANKIRSLGERYETLPIIALTANAVSGMKEMFIANGLSDFLAKPIEVSKLNAILATWLPKEKIIKGGWDKEKNDMPAFEIEGVDVASGICHAGGSKDVYLEVLRYFCMDAATKLTEIPDTLKRRDVKLYTTCVHALKGASANIGADKLSEMAAALEMAANSGDMVFASENTGYFLDELKKMVDRISDLLQNQEVTQVENEDDPDTIRDKLERLKAALADIDTDAADALVRDLSVGHMSELMNEVSQSILLFDYEKATDLIDGFIQTSLREEDSSSETSCE